MTGPSIATWGFAVIATILLGFAAIVLWKILAGDIRLNDLIAEPALPGEDARAAKASLSRFQFLLFTFVVAGLFLLLSIEAGTFVEVPSNVLGLLGISGGSYVVAKAVGNAKKDGDGATEAAAETAKTEAIKAEAAKTAAAEGATKAENVLIAIEAAAARAEAAAREATLSKVAAEAAAERRG